MNIEESNTEYLSLKSLLHQWKLMHLLQHFIAQNISVDVLKMMKSQHIYELLRNFTYGDRIRFEYELEKWRYSIGNPLQNANQMHIMEIPLPIAMASTAMPNNTTRIVPSKDCETQTNNPSPNINHEDSCSSQPYNSTPSPQPHLNVLKSSQPPPPPPRFENVLSGCKETIIYSPRIPARTSPARARDSQTRGRPTANLLAQQMSIKLDAREILERCRPRGPELMKIFETNKRFRPVERVELINVFAHYFYEHSIHLPVKLSYILEQQILKLFPGERLKDYRTEKRGKIYIRLSNIKNNRRAREAKAAMKQQETSNSRSDEDFQTVAINNPGFVITEENKMMLDEDKEDSSNCSDNPLTIYVTDIKQEISSDYE